MLRQAFRGPYVDYEVLIRMHQCGTPPQDIRSLVRGQGLFIEDNKDRRPLIDFDYWADVNENLRRQGAILPCDFEIGCYHPNTATTRYRPRIEYSAEHTGEPTRRFTGLITTGVELIRAGWVAFDNCFSAGQTGLP